MFGHCNKYVRCEVVDSNQMLHDRTRLTVVTIEKKFRVP